MAVVYESEHTEYKSVLNDKAIKTVIAFANTEGGTLVIGADDDGKPIGLASPDDELTRLTSMLRDSIKPDILMLVSSNIELRADVPVIVVRVGRGVKRPYYLASKGPRSEGVFVRKGAASIPASDAAILQMLRESEGDSFEVRRSLNQELTFDYAAEEFAAKGLPLGQGELRTLGAVDAAGAYTNLGLLLSDQCPPTVKSARFSDDARNTFTKREEYEGSILKQLADAYGFLEGCNDYRTDFAGLDRIDHHDYPPVALREALVNAIAHREYALSGPTLISAMPSSVQIVSLGGLPAGLEEADLKAHISMPRNRGLANVLFRLERIEAYGTGIERMRNSYRGSGCALDISVTANTFAVTLPNRNAATNRHVPVLQGNDATARVLELLAGGPKSRKDIQDQLGLSQSGALRALRMLMETGSVIKEGSGRNTTYRIRS